MIKTLTKIQTTKNLWQKGMGVIGWRDFGDKNGLLLTNTNSIHTFFVRFSLDLVFLDQKMKIIRLVENLKPFSFSPIVWKARHVLEMPAGSIKKSSLKTGDSVHLI
jgi:hypothetical protein